MMSRSNAGLLSRQRRLVGRRLSSGRRYDIVVAGGGVVGACLARVLSRSAATKHLSVAVLDSRRPPPFDSTPMTRAYALSPTSLEIIGTHIIDRLGDRIGWYDSMQVILTTTPRRVLSLLLVGWPVVCPVCVSLSPHVTSIAQRSLFKTTAFVQVWEAEGPARLHFTAKNDLSSTSGSTSFPNVLGAVIEDAPLVSALWEELECTSNVHLLAPVQVTKIVAQPLSSGSSSAPVRIHLGGEEVVTASLLVGADGQNSFVRKSVGSMPLHSWGFGRRALVCTVAVEDMPRTAFQRMMTAGPLALLPMSDRHANVVWSTTPSHATHLQSLPCDQFIHALNATLQTGTTISSTPATTGWPAPIQHMMHGLDMLITAATTSLLLRDTNWKQPPRVSSVIGKRVLMDLSTSNASVYSVPRVVLVGDAAHSIHPMIGQGLNLGLLDVLALQRQIERHVTSGMDFDVMDMTERRREVQRVIYGIEFLHTLFGGPNPLGIRTVGMNAMNQSAWARAFLTGVATGRLTTLGRSNNALP